MRGFASFAVVLIAALVLLELMALRENSLEEQSFFETKALALERRHYDGLYFKNGVREAMQTGIPDGALSAAETARRLSEFGRFAESGEIKMWAGYVDDYDIEEMRDQSLQNERPVKCAACFGLSEMTIDNEGMPAYKTQALLDGKVTTKISSNGLARVTIPSFGKKPAIGATFYYPEARISAVEFVGEGFP